MIFNMRKKTLYNIFFTQQLLHNDVVAAVAVVVAVVAVVAVAAVAVVVAVAAVAAVVVKQNFFKKTLALKLRKPFRVSAELRN